MGSGPPCDTTNILVLAERLNAARHHLDRLDREFRDYVAAHKIETDAYLIEYDQKIADAAGAAETRALIAAKSAEDRAAAAAKALGAQIDKLTGRIIWGALAIILAGFVKAWLGF